MPSQPISIDPGPLAAIDVHVHLEADEPSATDDAARSYFGDTGAPRDPDGLADYYRSRRMAFVVFTVDERLSGRPHVTNDDVAAVRVGPMPTSRWRSPASIRPAERKRCAKRDG